MKTLIQSSQHSIQSLFSKLALPSDELSIHRFTHSHHLTSDTMLADAYFWNEDQLNFIQEALWMDSGWAKPLDKLDGLLRK